MNTFTLSNQFVKMERTDQNQGSAIPKTSGISIELENIEITKLISRERRVRRAVRRRARGFNDHPRDRDINRATYEGTISFAFGKSKTLFSWKAREENGSITLLNEEAFKNQLLYVGNPDLVPVQISMIESDMSEKEQIAKIQKVIGAAGSFANLFPPHGALVSASGGILSAFLDIAAANVDNELELGYYGALPDWQLIKTGLYTVKRVSSDGNNDVEIAINLRISENKELAGLKETEELKIDVTPASDPQWVHLNKIKCSTEESLGEATGFSTSIKIGTPSDTVSFEFTNKVKHDEAMLHEVLGIENFPFMPLSNTLMANFSGAITEDKELLEALWGLADPIGDLIKARDFGDTNVVEKIDDRLEFIQSLKSMTMELLPNESSYYQKNILLKKPGNGNALAPITLKSETAGQELTFSLGLTRRKSYKLVKRNPA